MKTMSHITDDTLSKLEKLSKLRLSVDERVEIKADLEKIVTMFDKLSEVDTSGVKPLLHISRAKNILRSDTVADELSQDNALRNVPHVKDGHIAVPKFLKPKK